MSKSELGVLTPTQREVLKFIGQYRTECQAPPTRAEIAQYFGWRSQNAAQTHIDALERKNWIKVEPNVSRGIYVMASP